VLVPDGSSRTPTVSAARRTRGRGLLAPAITDRWSRGTVS
jgi:hypothetical protein